MGSRNLAPAGAASGDWHPWAPEALAKAKAGNRPILLIIGYSACHWCHVMERESFEDPAIARLMNELFVNIKVDREERPDLDQIYQNTVRQILDGLGHLSTFKEAAEPLNTELLDRVGRALTRHVDPVYGGFGRAPKFPNIMNHAFLLRQFRARQDEFALRRVTLTLEKMAGGGIFDHLGGGFYSTQDADSQGVEGKLFIWTRDGGRTGRDTPCRRAREALRGPRAAAEALPRREDPDELERPHDLGLR